MKLYVVVPVRAQSPVYASQKRCDALQYAIENKLCNRSELWEIYCSEKNFKELLKRLDDKNLLEHRKVLNVAHRLWNDKDIEKKFIKPIDYLPNFKEVNV